MTARCGVAWFVLLVLAAASVGGCEIKAAEAQAFMTSKSRIAFEPAPTRTGETILRVENNDGQKHKLVLVRLTKGLDPAEIPVAADGTVALGKPSDLEYRGDGYQVVEKLETMRPFFGRQRIKTVLHTYLEEGTYVMFCNLAGHYRRGEWSAFDVRDKNS